MNIKVIQGSIVDSTADIIVHQVNCQFVMGSGVAKALRDKYPLIYDHYINVKKENLANQIDATYTSDNYLGYAQFVHIGNCRYIVNLFGQNFYGYDGKQYTNYDAIECALYSIKRKILFNKNYKHIKTISFPWNMGAARGGGNWDIIKAMIEQVFSNTDIEIQYYQWSRN